VVIFVDDHHPAYVHVFGEGRGLLRTATIIGMVPFGTMIELHGFGFLRERKIQGSLRGSPFFGQAVTLGLPL
jgi:hypothetical protein